MLSENVQSWSSETYGGLSKGEDSRKGGKEGFIHSDKEKDSQKVAYKVVESEVWKHGNQFAE